MKPYVPVIGVVIGIVLLYNVIPKAITVILVMILLVLMMNRWDQLQSMF